MSQDQQSGALPATRRTGPLAGVRIVEFKAIGPVQFCAMLLADLGATVLRSSTALRHFPRSTSACSRREIEPP